MSAARTVRACGGWVHARGGWVAVSVLSGPACLLRLLARASPAGSSLHGDISHVRSDAAGSVAERRYDSSCSLLPWNEHGRFSRTSWS